MSSSGQATLTALWIAGVLGLTGCGKSRLELISLKDPYFPEKYTVSLDRCVYRQTPGGDVDIVGHMQRVASGETAAGEQYVHIHLFWTPRPGKTFDNPSSVDAVVRYLVVTPSGVTSYSGAGFAFPQRRSLGSDLVVRLESARLRPETETESENEILGEARVTGRLIARRDDQVAVDLMREAELVVAQP